MKSSIYQGEIRVPKGYRPAWADEALEGKATHAVCKHGILAQADGGSDHHCTWRMLVVSEFKA